MAITRDEILAAAKAMTPAERYDLIEDLRQLLDDSDELTPEQLAEIRRRIEQSDRGEAKSIPAEEAIAELRNKLRKMRRRRAS
ncbi:MAG: putative addiction module component [Humisphaera sp.]|nr:putative addiction module component [Humisphaera sp.]